MFENKIIEIDTGIKRLSRLSKSFISTLGSYADTSKCIDEIKYKTVELIALAYSSNKKLSMEFSKISSLISELKNLQDKEKEAGILNKISNELNNAMLIMQNKYEEEKKSPLKNLAQVVGEEQKNLNEAYQTIMNADANKDIENYVDLFSSYSQSLDNACKNIIESDYFAANSELVQLKKTAVVLEYKLCKQLIASIFDNCDGQLTVSYMQKLIEEINNNINMSMSEIDPNNNEPGCNKNSLTPYNLDTFLKVATQTKYVEESIILSFLKESKECQKFSFDLMNDKDILSTLRKMNSCDNGFEYAVDKLGINPFREFDNSNSLDKLLLCIFDPLKAFIQSNISHADVSDAALKDTVSVLVKELYDSSAKVVASLKKVNNPNKMTP